MGQQNNSEGRGGGIENLVSSVTLSPKGGILILPRSGLLSWLINDHLKNLTTFSYEETAGNAEEEERRIRRNRNLFWSCTVSSPHKQSAASARLCNMSCTVKVPEFRLQEHSIHRCFTIKNVVLI